VCLDNHLHNLCVYIFLQYTKIYRYIQRSPPDIAKLPIGALGGKEEDGKIKEPVIDKLPVN
jgi:hypothetical protein